MRPAQAAENFEQAERDYSPGNRWRHKRLNTWVVFYDSLKKAGKPAFFTYRAVAPCKPGRDPWTVDNRRTGEFKTLKAAFAFAGKGE